MEMAGDAVLVWCVQGKCKGVTEKGQARVISAGGVGVFFPRSTRMAVEAVQTPAAYHYLAIGGHDAATDCIAAGLWDGLTGKAEPPVELLERAVQHLEGNAPADVIGANIAAYEMLLHTARQLLGNAPDRMTHEAMHRMHWRYTDPDFSIAALQKEMGVSRSSLGTHIKKETGKSPLAYLTGIRLCLAKALLSETDKPIATVARESGFGCPVYFSQIISKHTGDSPRAYRRNTAAKPSCS